MAKTPKQKLKDKWQMLKHLFAICIHNGLLFQLCNEFLQTCKKYRKKSIENVECKMDIDKDFIERAFKYENMLDLIYN